MLVPQHSSTHKLPHVPGCRDELPYLLDLHLFLSRPLAPAAVQSVRQAAQAAEELARDTSLYGTFPQVGWGALHLFPSFLSFPERLGLLFSVGVGGKAGSMVLASSGGSLGALQPAS